MTFEKLFTPLLCDRLLPRDKDDLKSDDENTCGNEAFFKDEIGGINVYCEECAYLIFDKYKKDEE